MLIAGPAPQLDIRQGLTAPVGPNLFDWLLSPLLVVDDPVHTGLSLVSKAARDTAVAFAVLLAIVVFCYLVWDNLDGARRMVPTSKGGALTKMPFHSIAIRIVSSYLQVAGLLTRFDLTLPKAVHTLAVAESSSSSLSEQLLLFDCATDLRATRRASPRSACPFARRGSAPALPAAGLSTFSSRTASMIFAPRPRPRFRARRTWRTICTGAEL